MNADCIACWSATGKPQVPTREWLFDWIVPSTQGADAPMSAAALLAGAERAARAKLDEPTRVMNTQIASGRLAPRKGLQLTVQSGPAWNGYFGLQLSVQGQTPGGATAWMALVEPLPAGTDGSGVARELVRSVAGPLPLPVRQEGQRQPGLSRLTHLAALRAPDSAQPERLRARAWIEGADGRILAVASDGCRAASR